MSCGCSPKIVNKQTNTKPVDKLTKCNTKENTSINILNMLEEFSPYKHYAKNSLVMFEGMIYIASSEIYPSMVDNCCNNSGTPEYPDNSIKWVGLTTATSLTEAINSVKSELETINNFTVEDSTDNHVIKLETSKQTFNINIPLNKANASVRDNVLTITNPDGSTVTFRDTDTTYQAGDHLELVEGVFKATPETMVDGDTAYIDNGKIKAKQYDDSSLVRRVRALEVKPDKDTIYNDSELRNRVSTLEGKTDKFISSATVSRQGNQVTFKYTYNDGTEATRITFTDNDTVAIAYDDTEVRRRLTTLEQRPLPLNVENLVAEFDPNTAHIVVVDTSKPAKPDQAVFNQITGVNFPVTGGELILAVDLFNFPASEAFQKWWKEEKKLYTLENDGKYQQIGQGGSTQPLTANSPLTIQNNQVSLNFDPNYFVVENSKLRPIGSLSVGGSIKRLANLELTTTGVGGKYDGTEIVRPELTDIVRTYQGHIFISAIASGIPVDVPDEWVRMGTRYVDLELIPFDFYFNGSNIVDPDTHDHYIQRAYLKDDNNNVIGIFSRTTKRDVARDRQVPLGQKTEANWTNWVRLDTPNTVSSTTTEINVQAPLRKLTDGSIKLDYNLDDFALVNASNRDVLVSKSVRSYLVGRLWGLKSVEPREENSKKVVEFKLASVFTDNTKLNIYAGENPDKLRKVKFKVFAPTDCTLTIKDYTDIEANSIVGNGTNELSFNLIAMLPSINYEFPIKFTYPTGSPTGTEYSVRLEIDTTGSTGVPKGLARLTENLIVTAR